MLIIDEAHQHLWKLNELVDHLAATDNAHLKLLIIASKNQWFPRVKSPNIARYGKDFSLSRLSSAEVERLLDLLSTNSEIQNLVEEQFSGYNRQERRRRLVERCQSDMFVCLKNIFANDSFDTIILQEYASLPENYQEVYKIVSALETAGVRVHRQLVIRLLGIPADHIPATLGNLTDIVTEYDIDERFGIFGWRCRHAVISGIISKFKFQEINEVITLFERVIDSISPTYDVELRSMRELCSIDTGIARIADKDVQNRLFRKMISNAPGERVPRHKLIRNLISQERFEKAETEIRLFHKDFGADGPVQRHKIRLMVARAIQTPGILREDRIAYLRQAYDVAVGSLDKFVHHKLILLAFGELAVEYYKITGSYEYFDEVVQRLREAEEYLGDPEIGFSISRLERRMAGKPLAKDEELLDEAS